MNPNTYYSCSSWNYGAYAPCNPCFIQQNKYYSNANQNRYNPAQNNYACTKFGKRILPEEERIVTNEYMKEINHIKKMERAKDSFKSTKTNRPRSNYITKENNENTKNASKDHNNNTNNNNNNVTNIKTDTNNYKFRLTYEEWLEVKNKQQQIFNQIKKIKEEEDQKMEKVNMKVDRKYKEIKDKKYK